MSIKTLKNEIEKISLTSFQRDNVNEHFNKISNEIKKQGIANNIQKQGSFGRGTVIKGQESDGFDLDIAILVNNNNASRANQLNDSIMSLLKKLYPEKIMLIEKKQKL
ncbi:SMODS domain-containing nucleotidyltransferase [Spiroplasma turonicum]|uniref:Polymerase nucleotidyl transferase domain-containing protein n=1 Tax=Spiroplasma turonicum TaxID=216946 RepID=A0A0K1P686_9MOLU|nr:hypothetical protein [Spiroplasma turonicum]AKU79833.1 hypothetical protein STURON_00587 [Spiroplasma turonicum]ALX70849.1 hypothetical protein STURO_v1c05830 [Spiroplasma turonicum]